MDIILYAAGIMAFAPTLILMYAVLRKYTYPAVEQPFFSDPAFFGIFVVGLIAGTLLFAVFTYLDRMNMIYAILFAAIQCLAMVVVLNLKRFHGKSDSVFYGYGLGLGMGCTMAFGTIYYYGTISLFFMEAEGSTVSMTGYVWLFLIALSYVLVLSAIGTTIGEGIARLRPMEFALQTIFVNVVFGLIIWGVFANGDALFIYASLFVALIVAAVYFYYVMYVKLSGVVRDVLRMEGKTRKDVPK
ncbi:MAG: hypothetical protein FWG41_04645 [Methanomassiliicoccaceae archaeon]|nr:hypothetical protein [Methanomassiliicoccaceae archaeon]